MSAALPPEFGLRYCSSQGACSCRSSLAQPASSTTARPSGCAMLMASTSPAENGHAGTSTDLSRAVEAR